MDADRTWFATFVAVVFLAGLSTGVLLDPGPSPADGSSRESGRAADVLASRLADGLALSEDQRARLEWLVELRDAQLRALRRDATARLDAELRLVRDEIFRILTPEQKQRFDEIAGKSLRALGRSRRSSPTRQAPEEIQGP